MLTLYSAPSTGAGQPPTNVDAELALARTPGLYVVIDPGRGTVDVKVRGKVFVTLPMAGWAFLSYRLKAGQETADDLEGTVASPAPAPAETGLTAAVSLPATLRVTGDPEMAVRRVETIAALRPFSNDTEEGGSATPPPALPAPPASFEIPLESGWVLHVGPELPPTRGFAAWRSRLADGWASLRGRPPARPPLLALALDAQTAERLYHVLRPGTAVLVLSPVVEP